MAIFGYNGFVMPILSTTKMTAEQFLQLGEDPPGVRLELVEGEIAVSLSAILEHAYAEMRLTLLLGNHIDANPARRALPGC
jgi:Uma2 family endonuclease